MTEELLLSDGRRLRWFDDGGSGRILLWHHGTPGTGRAIAPLLEAARARGLRLIGAARSGYPGSDATPGRTVAQAAADVVELLDRLDARDTLQLGSSGGGPHALATAALARGRVAGVATFAGLAPFRDSSEWWEGMLDTTMLRAALAGREERARAGEGAEFDPEVFLPRDWDVLQAEWAPLGDDAGAGGAEGADGEVDDDVAFTRPWGVDLGAVTAPVLVAHGGSDRMVPAAHGRLLLEALPEAELWLRPRDGHIAVLRALPLALDWLLEHTG